MCIGQTSGCGKGNRHLPPESVPKSRWQSGRSWLELSSPYKAPGGTSAHAQSHRPFRTLDCRLWLQLIWDLWVSGTSRAMRTFFFFGHTLG
jgi:hypothetical protein